MSRMLASITFPSSNTALTFIPILLSTRDVYAQAPCYYPDGFTEAPLHVPCNSSTLGTPQSATACCRNSPTSYCVSNGLCYYNGVLSRGSCTDKTWASPNCARDCTTEHLNASISIFNCQEQGTFQCGWGDCSTNFTDQTPSSIILRDHQKSAATSIPSKTSNSLAVGLGVGLSLGICLLGSLLLSCRQRYRLKKAESATGRRSTKSTERSSNDWQWPLGSGLSPACQGHSPSPPQSVYTSPVRREELPRVPSARRGPAPPPTISTQGHLHALREGRDELHELDGYNYNSNGTRQFV